VKTAVLSAVLLAVIAPTSVPAGTFTETFAATAYRDAVATTAAWDTVVAELRLQPFAPSLVGGHDTPGLAWSVTVAGDVAFVADGDQGLRILNIADPANPTLITTVSSATVGIAQGVAVTGDLAFVASGDLRILDVTNPAAPTLLATFTTSGNAQHVVVSGDFAYVADGFSGLTIVNVTFPSSPSLEGAYATPEFAQSVVVAGDLAFVSDGSNESPLILDVSTPSSPVLVATDFTGNAECVAVAGNVLLTSSLAFDISDPTDPVFLGWTPVPEIARGMAVAGHLAFLACGSSGLQVVDFSDPANPAVVGAYDTPGSAEGVAVAGDLAFIADHDAGVHILRIATLVPPTVRGTDNTPGTAQNVAIDGDLAFVADDAAGLRIVDIGDPTNPSPVGTYDTPGTARDVAVAGDLALVADGASGLQLVDITNPASPALFGTFNTSGNAHAVAVDGDYAFVADGTSVQIFYIQNPATPSLVGSYATTSATSIAVAGNELFVTDGAILRILDISMIFPAQVGWCVLGDNGLDVAVSGDLAFVAAEDAGLKIVDISNLASPSVVGTYNTTGIACRVAVAGDLAFVADGSSGLHVMDITNPASPVPVSTYDTPGGGLGVGLAGLHSFIADGSSGMHVVQVLQNEVDVASNRGQSLAVNGASDAIVRARLTSTQSSGVAWELSADAGVSFQSFTPGAAWAAFSSPGDDLVWRTTHTWVASGNPTVSDVTIEWLNEFAVIASVSDIPNDQGRSVRATWMRSGRDFPGDVVVEYAVYRQVDPDLSKAEASRATHLDELGPVSRAHARMMLTSGWDYLATVPALREESYSVVVPTLADSTISNGEYQSVFRVTALTATPGVFFDSPPDSGYSLDNLPPGVPQGFASDENGGSVDLVWEPAPEPDFRYFRIYRSTDPGFVPGPGTLVHETTATSWQDSPPNPESQTYRITAIDFSGNESAPASTGVMTSVDGDTTLPVAFALRGATPNPARARAHIAFDLPAQAAVSLLVFDVGGRVVRTLARASMPAGAHVVGWDGRDESGRRVPAGVYLYRLRAGSNESSGRLTLIR
jgi:hypothetical protein